MRSLPETNYAMSQTVTLPGLAAGNYYLILSVDWGHNVYESS